MSARRRTGALLRIPRRARLLGSADPIDPDIDAGPTRLRLRILLAIAAGGVIGAVGRYELGLALATRPGSFPWSTLLINITGSFGLGAIFTLMVERWPPRPYLRPFVTTGLIGAYTTWSTFAVEADDLARRGQAGLAAEYVGISLVAGLAAVYVGILLARLGGRATAWPAELQAAGDGLEEQTR